MAETTLLSLYLSSPKLHVAEARNIPDLAVNFIDTPNKFQVGWSNFQQFKKTTYTDLAYKYYEELRLNMVTPESFSPADTGINLNRWGPGHGYYNPGTPQG